MRFEFLHPPLDHAVTRRNNLSCVLRIATAAGAVLLTGDIERPAELALLSRGIPRTEIVIVPHHGSRSSSSREFIAALSPAWAIVPVGYRSRFGHPAAEVLERYRAAGAKVVRTDLEGAVHIRFGAGLQIEAERQRRGRYWLQ